MRLVRSNGRRRAVLDPHVGGPGGSYPFSLSNGSDVMLKLPVRGHVSTMEIDHKDLPSRCCCSAHGRASPRKTSRGRWSSVATALAEQMCSQCHAVRRGGESRAPRLRRFHRLDRRVDLDSFVEQLHEGLHQSASDMPTFSFLTGCSRLRLVRYIHSA